MVITLDDHLALTPAGRPFAPVIPSLAIPVAPVVLCVTLAIAVLTQPNGLIEPTDAVLLGVMDIVKLAQVVLPVQGLLAILLI